MSDSTVHGKCPQPFYEEALFSSNSGYIPGRFCLDTNIIEQGLRCCLGCPATEWIYPDNFDTLTRIAGPINLVGLALQLYMLLCFLILPVDKTRRHYLNICLILSICFLELGFIIPWAKQPPQCYDAITPNDLNTSMTCAWSGAFLVFGGVGIIAWVLVRTLYMHLQICWDKTPAADFFWAAQTFAWGVTILVSALELRFTGVSFRFGSSCHINHIRSLQTFWIWVLLMAGIALLLQLATFGYCTHAYLKNVSTLPQHQSQPSEPSLISSTRSQTARAIYRRIRKVLAVQWRSLLLAAITTADVTYFAIIFLLLDDSQARIVDEVDKVWPWAFCIIANGGDKNKCLSLAKQVNSDEVKIIATLMVLAVIGIESFMLICRWEMIACWAGLMRRSKSNVEWVSVDAARYKHGDYEMMKMDSFQSPPASYNLSTDDTSRLVGGLKSPASTYHRTSSKKPAFEGLDLGVLPNREPASRQAYQYPATPSLDTDKRPSWSMPQDQADSSLVSKSRTQATRSRWS